MGSPGGSVCEETTSRIPRDPTTDRETGTASTAVGSSMRSSSHSGIGVRGRFSVLTGLFARLENLSRWPTGDVLVVDLIGLFHPEALPALDLTTWVDVLLDVARERGMRRDEDLGRDHSLLWREVWIPNEIEFDRNFSPRESAEVLYSA